MPRDLRTKAIVLRRTNYGEADRILSLLTPDGKISVLAKAVRKEKSKLAGGIELFSISDIVVRQGKGELGILTSSKMLKFYQNIMSDIESLTLVSEILRQIDRAAEQTNSPEYFEILRQVLENVDQGASLFLVEVWFLLNFARVNGEEINLVRDVNGNKLEIDQNYVWDVNENALRLNDRGNIGASEIKLARFLVANPLGWATKITNVDSLLPAVLVIAKCINKSKA